MIIPQSVTEIGKQCFEGCVNLTNLVIPDSVTTIDRETTFANCPKLTEKCSKFKMDVVDYYRTSHQRRIEFRVHFLTCLKIHQELIEAEQAGERPTNRRRTEIVEGELNSPLAWRRITAFELWREIVMFF